MIETIQDEDEETADGSASVVHAKNALKAAFKTGFYDHLWHKKGLRKASHEIKHLQRDNLFFRVGLAFRAQ